MIRISLPIVAVFAAWAFAASGQDDDSRSPLDVPDPLAEMLEDHCQLCHEGEEPAGDLDLSVFPEGVRPARQLELTGELIRRVRAQEMPPPDLAVLEPEERASLVRELDDLALALVRRLDIAPPHVTVRRLSRTEYRNTVRDLFGIECQAVDRFPADDLGHGFDNIGAALSTSMLHLEKYVAAADEIGSRTIPDEPASGPETKRVEAEQMFCSIGLNGLLDGAVNLYRPGYIRDEVFLARSGRYRVRVHAGADQAGDELATMDLRLGGRSLARLPVDANRTTRKTYEVEAELEVGSHRLQLAFINDYYEPENPNPEARDRNLHLDWVEIVGPLDAPAMTPGEEWILGRDPKEGKTYNRAEPIVSELLRRTWRRPPTPDEKRRYQRLVLEVEKQEGSFRQGIRRALEAALVSPSFLYRIEPEGRSDRLSPYSLATRLSYFLWSSTPDVRLLELAESGELSKEDVLVAEVKRLLEDPRASALATNFAAQWLELRNLSIAQPDPERFPTFDEALRDSLRRESELFFEDNLRRKRPARELLTADYTFLNEHLARHYGIAGIEGAELRRVELTDARRGGLLAHGSVHTVTSNPTRTSVVKRGKWILTNLLDATPPSPPPGNDSFPDEEAVTVAATLREQLERHRAKAECASCHVRMDALGFALENYDPIGRWRDSDAGGPIDSSAELPSGLELAGVSDLEQHLADSPDFLVALAKKLFVYAVGREVEVLDDIRLRRLIARLSTEASLEDIIIGIVQLDAFREPARQ